MNEQTNLPSVNMTVDVKKAILTILEKSDRAYSRWAEQGSEFHPTSCIRIMDANNDAIRAILNSIS